MKEDYETAKQLKVQIDFVMGDVFQTPSTIQSQSLHVRHQTSDERVLKATDSKTTISIENIEQEMERKRVQIQDYRQRRFTAQKYDSANKLKPTSAAKRSHGSMLYTSPGDLLEFSYRHSAYDEQVIPALAKKERMSPKSFVEVDDS